MSEWKEYKTTDLLEQGLLVIGDGYRAKNIELSASKFDGLPFARVGNINEGFNFHKADYFPNNNLKKVGEKISKVGDVVFTSKGTVGRFAFVNNKSPMFVYSPQLCFWRSLDQNFILPRFLLYWMQSREFFEQADAVKSQTDMADYVNLSDQRKMKITLPAINEQTAIASVLSSLDNKIDLLHCQNATLEKMAETLFRQWFVEEAKEDWEIVMVGDFVKTNIRGITKGYRFQEIEYLDTSSLTKGVITETQKLSLNDSPSRAKRLVQNNDILISTVRPDQNHYGIINNPVENLVVSTGFCVITCTEINPYFIYLLLTNDEMTQYLHSIAEGSTSTYPSLKPSDIEKIEFAKPPTSRIIEFGNLAESYWIKIHKNQTQIRTLTALRDSLLPKLMSGEAKVVL